MKTHTRPSHLPLHAFTAIKHENLILTPHNHTGQSSLIRRNTCRGAEKNNP
jgi:hypothetical protein